MKKISIVYTYFNQYQMLNVLFKYYDKFLDKSIQDKINFIIVDDCSHKYPAHNYFPKTKNLNFEIWRTDYKKFNVAGARNLGVIKSRADNIVSVDIDMILTNNLLCEILNYKLTNNEYKRFLREGPLSIDLENNLFLYKQIASPVYIKRELYMKYPMDEDFNNHYGYEDEYFKDILKYNKIKSSFFTNRIVMYPIYVKDRNLGKTPKNNPGYTIGLDREGDIKINYDLYCEKKKDFITPKMQLNFNYKLTMSNYA